MKLMQRGDYYVWYCDWCDSRNNTLWTRLETGKVVCGVCYTPFVIASFQDVEQMAVVDCAT